MSPPESTETSRVAEFEQSLDELELLVGRMEKGDMSLDDSLTAFERGVGLYRQCRSALDQAELRVRQIIDPNDLDGAPRFDPDTP
ncbi:MAG: exodeoxyribonuclease VII small subunit [Rhodanobacteraceae bacterium]|nr:exodeoxyribonuclease VII small subunit [Rhodanobacteraceae bacterium]MBK7043234.1 exodeoxyribonuclease VII small subunit [Rhodanobacteraceae bacterium]MBP9153957.1 exodeoxyribonuclease VII small subunit [Xanthomonadales bacterium]HQW82231.1 exodeoxyribonuclease VII small subunit [Pseudomonadota bacterium]